MRVPSNCSRTLSQRENDFKDGPFSSLDGFKIKKKTDKGTLHFVLFRTSVWTAHLKPKSQSLHLGMPECIGKGRPSQPSIGERKTPTFTFLPGPWSVRDPEGPSLRESSLSRLLFPLLTKRKFVFGASSLSSFEKPFGPYRWVPG